MLKNRIFSLESSVEEMHFEPAGAIVDENIFLVVLVECKRIKSNFWVFLEQKVTINSCEGVKIS